MGGIKISWSLCWPVLLLLTLGGCVTTSTGSRRELLDFLKQDPVTRQDVIAHLGEPNATFEHDHVLAYHLGSDKGGFIVQRTKKDVTGWEDVNYDLMLVFDENGLLLQHNLVTVRAP